MKGFDETIKAAIPDATFVTTDENGLNISYEPGQTYDAYRTFLLGQPERPVHRERRHRRRARQPRHREPRTRPARSSPSAGTSRRASSTASRRASRSPQLDQRWSDQAAFGGPACAQFLKNGVILPNTQTLLAGHEGRRRRGARRTRPHPRPVVAAYHEPGPARLRPRLLLSTNRGNAHDRAESAIRTAATARPAFRRPARPPSTSRSAWAACSSPSSSSRWSSSSSSRTSLNLDVGISVLRAMSSVAIMALGPDAGHRRRRDRPLLRRHVRPRRQRAGGDVDRHAACRSTLAMPLAIGVGARGRPVQRPAGHRLQDPVLHRDARQLQPALRHLAVDHATPRPSTRPIRRRASRSRRSELDFFTGLTAELRPVRLSLEVLWMLVLAVVVGCLLHRSLFGFRLMAIGGNPVAAQLARLPVTRYKIIAFMLCGDARGDRRHPRLLLHPDQPARTSACRYTFPVFAAVIIGGASLAGGKGTMIGTHGRRAAARRAAAGPGAPVARARMSSSSSSAPSPSARWRSTSSLTKLRKSRAA